MIHKLNYASLVLDGDIPCYEFKSKDELLAFVGSEMFPLRDDIVYLVCIEDEVFVTERGIFVYELFENSLRSVWAYYEGDACHIHEYSSYEEAYKVALDLKETSPLCYEKDETI
jgi:hypothetical protein